jgi:hypothetical protein
VTIASAPIAPDGERSMDVEGPFDLRRTLGIHRRGPIQDGDRKSIKLLARRH